MDVKFDFHDVDTFFEEAEREVAGVLESVGKEAVEYAVSHGNYQNNTGLLRRSNKYEADKDGLVIYNDAENNGFYYAESVEQKGYEVISGAILQAEKRLKEEFEQ